MRRRTRVVTLGVGGVRIVRAPEFHEFLAWARGADIMFAEAAAWKRPIRFAGDVRGHLDVRAVAETDRRLAPAFRRRRHAASGQQGVAV